METVEENKIICVCTYEFTEKSIFTHLHHRTNNFCMGHFDKEKYESLKAAKDKSRKDYMKRYNKDYYEKHGPELKARRKTKYVEDPSSVKKKRKHHYGENNQKRREFYSQHKETIKQKSREFYSQHKETINQKRRELYSQHKGTINQKAKTPTAGNET